MTKILDCCLTLVCHKSLEERLIDHLLEHPEWVGGFSAGKIEGHSLKEHLPSMLEQVRGRSQRIEIRCIMNLADAHALVEHLKQQEANSEVAYWISPVIEYGRLA
jgi:hypothetical protein